MLPGSAGESCERRRAEPVEPVRQIRDEAERLLITAAAEEPGDLLDGSNRQRVDWREVPGHGEAPGGGDAGHRFNRRLLRSSFVGSDRRLCRAGTFGQRLLGEPSAAPNFADDGGTPDGGRV